jgi:hypothetical protein
VVTGVPLPGNYISSIFFIYFLWIKYNPIFMPSDAPTPETPLLPRPRPYERRSNPED